MSDAVFTSATALAAGCATTGNICGGCSGSILALGSLLGRDSKEFSTELGNAAV